MTRNDTSHMTRPIVAAPDSARPRNSYYNVENTDHKSILRGGCKLHKLNDVVRRGCWRGALISREPLHR